MLGNMSVRIWPIIRRYTCIFQVSEAGGGTNPLQEFVDGILCTDGKPSNESAVYNPDKPYENRDPRFICL